MDVNVKLIPEILASLRLGAPLLVLLGAAVAVLLADVLLPSAGRRRALPLLALAGVVFSFTTLFSLGAPAQGNTLYFFGALLRSGLTELAQGVILGATAFVVLISPRWLAGRAVARGEYYALLLLAALGMMALAASAELLALFLNLELVSIALYILAGMERRNAAASEAAFKYFLLGSFAAAFLLLGIAFVFGATGATRYPEIARAIHSFRLPQPFFLPLGFGLVFVGFAFKLTLAPFHMYAPDLYEGAPTPVAALVATASKVAGFTALFNFVALYYGNAALLHVKALWAVLYALAALSMVVGNVGAIVQPGLKRLLAYSSIAHSAYMLVPIVVMLTRPDLFAEASRAVGYYLVAYTVMTLVAFGVPATLGARGEGSIEDWRGLGRRSPWLAAAMTLALISLIGIPPTVGFFGKFQLFTVAVRGGHIGLAILGVLSSVASAFYYLRLVVLMFMSEPAEDEAAPAAVAAANRLALGLGALGILALIFLAGM